MEFSCSSIEFPRSSIDFPWGFISLGAAEGSEGGGGGGEVGPCSPGDQIFLLSGPELHRLTDRTPDSFFDCGKRSLKKFSA